MATSATLMVQVPRQAPADARTPDPHAPLTPSQWDTLAYLATETHAEIPASGRNLGMYATARVLHLHGLAVLTPGQRAGVTGHHTADVLDSVHKAARNPMSPHTHPTCFAWTVRITDAGRLRAFKELGISPVRPAETAEDTPADTPAEPA